MKKLSLYLVALLFGGTILRAQNKQLLYDFKEIPQSLMVNPGVQVSYQWYAGIPALSGVSLQAATSGLTVHDIFADDGIDINQKVRERAVFGLNTRDEISGTFQIELLSGGFRGKYRQQDFYSFGMYLEGDAINYWPRDLAILAFEGNADMLDRRFDLSHLKTRGELVNVFHFGINREMDKNLTLGARAKLYSGIFNFHSTQNDGRFVTREGQNNLLSNTIVSDMRFRTAGLNEFRQALRDDNADEASAIREILTRKALLGGDLGLGVDFGFSYKLNEQTVVTGSVLDLGFIYNTKDVRTFTLNGSATTEGVEIIFPEALINPSADFWQDLVDEIEALVPFEENDKGYITFRPTKLYGSIRYDFGRPNLNQEDCNCDYRVTGQQRSTIEYTNTAGGQIYIINRPRGPQAALTAFYQRRFGRALSLKATYTIDKFTFTNVGLGMNLQAGPVNFYVLADNLLGYQNIPDSHYASFQFGLNIISWGRN